MIKPLQVLPADPRTTAGDAAIDPRDAGRLFALAFDMAEPEASLPGEDQPGDHIGPCTLIEKLGEGGFGIVWKAVQTTPIRRQVAVKVLRVGMDSRAVLLRFRAEQRALERMQHPNIASVLDAGMTAEGRPYFVLELVRGRPITTYCEQAALPVRQRLALFLDVCRAVQHAHQRAVLHRDLKPSNILVSEADQPPVPKVIDFGIAKALANEEYDAATLAQTVHGVLLGTPQYMAPEQAALGAQVTDIRVDVYALGAILYELLTGAPPLQVEDRTTTSLSVMLARIHEEDAVRPSARAAARRAGGNPAPFPPESLRGDLDWIVLKALEKDPDRRYASAIALAEDLERHLADEPVNAGPPGRRYRFEKFVRRNRFACGMGAVVAANVLLLAVISTLGYLRESEAHMEAEAAHRRAVAEAARAAAESKKATALADFLANLLAQAGAFVDQGKNPEALRLAVDQSIASVKALEDQPEMQVELLGQLAAIYGAMGDSNRSLPIFATQLNLCNRIYGENDPRSLSVLLKLATATSHAGDKEKSLELYADLQRRWLARGDSGFIQRREALRSYARELSHQGQGKKAMEVMELTLLLDRNGGMDVSELRFQADLQTSLGLHAEAEKTLLRALPKLEQNNEVAQRTRVNVLQSLSRAESKQGKFDQAVRHLEEVVKCEEAQKGATHHSLIAKRIEIARIYAKLGRVNDALASTDAAVEIARETGNDEKLPKALRAAGEIREQVGQLEAALAFHRECMGLERQNNTDRGKWLYELSEIVRLLDQLKWHDDAQKHCMELWAGIQAEPQVQKDDAFLKSLYRILADACDHWQQSTGDTAHADDIKKWRALANG